MAVIHYFKKIFPKVLSYLICVILLLIPAIWNGYPLVYSDSGTYILSAPFKMVPVDRPIGYSIFVQYASFKYSLWFIVIFQAFIITYLIDLIIKEVTIIKNRPLWLSITIALLVITTGVDNYTCQIMADIWMPIMILSVALILVKKKNRDLTSFFLFALFIVAAMSHYTVLAAITVFVGLITLYWFCFSKRNKKLLKKITLLFSWCVIAWLLAPSINYIYHEGFKVSRTKNVVFAARLIEEGILQDYLNENCDIKPNFLCPYKDSIPRNCIDFMWGNSALYKGECLKYGWGECWVAHDKELGQIIKNIVYSPKYFSKIIKMAFISTYKQLIYFDIGMLVPMREGSPPYNGVKTSYNHELKQYATSKQFQRTLYYRFSSTIQFFTVIASTFFILFLVFRHLLSRKKNVDLSKIGFYSSIILFLILNAAICGTLAMVADRYQSRVIWLLPFIAIVALLNAFTLHNTKIITNTTRH